jgi:hypothetical protein
MKRSTRIPFVASARHPRFQTTYAALHLDTGNTNLCHKIPGAVLMLWITRAAIILDAHPDPHRRPLTPTVPVDTMLLIRCAMHRARTVLTALGFPIRTFSAPGLHRSKIMARVPRPVLILSLSEGGARTIKARKMFDLDVCHGVCCAAALCTTCVGQVLRRNFDVALLYTLFVIVHESETNN